MRNWLRAGLLALLACWGTAVSADLAEGILDWSRPVSLSTPVSGMVAEVLVRPGDTVAAGAALVRLDPRPFNAAIARARARVDVWQQERAETAREMERGQQLYERTVLSNHELELTRIAHAKADAEYRAARAVLAQAELDLEYSVVRAPFAALVLRREVEVGQTVISIQAPMPLVTVAEADRLLARAHVTATQAARLRPGQPVPVQLGELTLNGTVEQVYPEPVTDDAGYRVEVAVPFTPRQGPLPGQHVRMELP